MGYLNIIAGILISSLVFTSTVNCQERAIIEKELHDKISAFWLGQLVGNYYGLPFENKYVDEAVPFLVNRVYTYKDDEYLKFDKDIMAENISIKIKFTQAKVYSLSIE